MPVPVGQSRARRIAGLAAIVGLALASRGGAAEADALRNGSAEAEPLRVAAATSLREVAEAVARSFEADRAGLRIATSFGASSVLAAQLRAGAPLDVLLSADAELAAALAGEGVVEPPVTLARNRLVVIARPELAPFASAEALAGPAVRRLAVPLAAVPAGRYAREWLAAHGLLARLEDRLVATEHARATLVAVDSGAADAAVVYATEVPRARRAHVVWEIPDAEQPEIVYAAAVSRDARDPALARAFVAMLVGGVGREHLLRAGFAPASP